MASFFRLSGQYTVASGALSSTLIAIKRGNISTHSIGSTACRQRCCRRSSCSSSNDNGFSPLAGRVAVVTGGAGAIGKAITQALALDGATVVMAGRRLCALETAAKDIIGKVGKEREAFVHCLALDVTSEEQVVTFFETVMADHGKCDILINNAGVAMGGTVTEISAETFSAVMDVNVLGPFLCSREAFRHMQNHGSGGRIINVASISSMSPRPMSVPYTTSKYAVQGLSRSFALDGRPHNIAVSSIHPGNVVSDLLSPQEVKRRKESEGFITPEEVANSVLHMVKLPLSANILDMTVMPTKQPLIGRG